MSHMEQKFERFDNEIKDIRNDLKHQSERLKDEEFQNSIIEDRMSKTENAKERLAWENNELREEILEMKCHSMKYNLLFSGIPEPSSWKDENTEEVVKEFIQKELNVDSTTMSFQNVHRLKQRTDGKPRSIVARFTSYNDHEKVRRTAIEKLKNNVKYSVYQQYPMEISERRKYLLPKLNDAKKHGRRARLQNDKLFIEGQMGVYIPPENSKYASKEVFTEIEDELLHLQDNRCNIALLGDFNAKTRTLDDFVVPDDSLFEVLDNFDDNELLVYLYDYQKLLLHNISLPRFSEDTSSVNNYGYKLLDFCKKLNIYIGNSRLNGNDKSVGKKTCKDVSLVDYFLLSSNAFPTVKSFDVLDFNPLYSDVHCGLSVYLHSNVKKNTTKQNVGHCSKSNYIKWNAAKQDEFVEAIFSSQLSFGELDTIFNDECEGNQVKHIIDKAVSKIGLSDRERIIYSTGITIFVILFAFLTVALIYLYKRRSNSTKTFVAQLEPTNIAGESEDHQSIGENVYNVIDESEIYDDNILPNLCCRDNHSEFVPDTSEDECSSGYLKPIACTNLNREPNPCISSVKSRDSGYMHPYPSILPHLRENQPFIPHAKQIYIWKYYLI
ncbi:unnamed protein product [Mytilus edulis]|uniref:Endonuclease/exonuclease/phosphatase domain-containing protein n=1 Tax=Mytilus edulis TaxID=6550 RepID=A0A8S3VKH0_MYTED|nr:unnamed protein product [Mytilus edulis]